MTGEEFYVTPCFRLGWEFGSWECGKGILNLRIGLEATCTYYCSTEEENAFSNAIGSFIGTVFNVPKLSVSATYFLPM